jgi:hypothetical protein
MTPTRLLKTILLALTLTTATSAHAVLDLTGVEMQGELLIGASALNFFDPVFPGKVPPGFGNSPSPGGTGEASAFVSDSIVEFGYSGSLDANIQVNFSTIGVVQVSASNNPFTSVNMSFNSPAFQNPMQVITFTPINSTPFITAGFSNSTFTVSFTTMTTGAFSGTYLLNVQGTPPPQIPEPASLTLLGLGLAGIIARYRKRT